MKLELKTLINALDATSRRFVELSAQRSIGRNGLEILIEDLFYVMLEEESSVLNKLLEQYEIEPSRLQNVLEKSFQSASRSESSSPVFSKLLVDLIESAYLESKIEFNLEEVNAALILYALFKNSRTYAMTAYYQVFDAIDTEKLLELLEGFIKEKYETEVPTNKMKNNEADKSDLEKYTVNLTNLAKEGKIDPVFSRDEEIKQAIDILSRRRKNNPILVGEAGVGKTAVVEGLALKIVQKEVPKHFYDAQILSLDLGALQAGASVKGEFERRLQAVINAIKSSTQFTILFIDEAHTLIGAGGNEGGSDAANLLKPALARGELKTIAATTWKEYRKYFEKDPALARRFQKIDLLEPSIEESVTILRGIASKYEEVHNVYIEDEALVAAASLSARYITGRQLPDKAIDILDTACANVKISASNRPFSLQQMDGDIAILQREYDSLKRDHDAYLKDNSEALTVLELKMSEIDFKIKDEEKIFEEQKVLLARIKMLKKEGDRDEVEKAYEAFKLLQEKNAYVYENVSAEQISEVIASWTGIPLGNMKQEQAKSMSEFSSEIKKRIIGQDESIDYISNFLQVSMAGLKKESSPEGVFLLVGPSGVGKTETAIAISELLFGGEAFMTTINMSEFQEKHTVSRLLGSPPGYVGYGDGGQLTDPVRIKPYSVILLDEIEKAHPDILNIFYQIFDKGIANDGEGRAINFKNTVIIMTSNLATEEITNLCSENENIDMESIREQITPALTKYLKPALLGRMTVIPYKNLSLEVLSKIASLKLESIEKQLQAQGIELSYDEALLEQIVSLSNATETGARNLEMIINNTLMPKLSSAILESRVENQQIVKMTMSLDEEKNVNVTVEYQ